jgi:hypothetical protein
MDSTVDVPTLQTFLQSLGNLNRPIASYFNEHHNMLLYSTLYNFLLPVVTSYLAANFDSNTVQLPDSLMHYKSTKSPNTTNSQVVLEAVNEILQYFNLKEKVDTLVFSKNIAQENLNVQVLLSYFNTPYKLTMLGFAQQVFAVLQLASAVKQGVSKRRPEDFDLFLNAVVPLFLSNDMGKFLQACKNYLNEPQLCFYFNGRVPHLEITHHWSGPLKTVKCDADNCWRWVSIGLPYCEEHLATIMKLKIKPSTVKGAGNGVFAWDPTLAGTDIPVFKKNTSVCIYDGEVIDEEELIRRYYKNFELKIKNKVVLFSFTKIYLLRQSQNKFIDSACARYVASCINHMSSKKNNCYFKGTEVTKIVTKKAIYHDTELFLYYGPEYFYNKKRIPIQESYDTRPCE